MVSLVGWRPMQFLCGLWVAASGGRVVSGWIPRNRNAVQFRQPCKSACESNSCLYLVSGYGVDGDGESERQSLLRLSTPVSELEVLLDGMIRYFDSMVDPATHRFYLLSHPQTPADRSQAAVLSAQPKELVSHVHCPLRELGCVWDATKALQVLRTTGNSGTLTLDGTNLQEAILQTVRHYGSSLEHKSSGAHLSWTILGEPPNIAHNGLLLLSLLGVWKLGLENENPFLSTMDGLARGILSQQRHDGAFQGPFDNPQEEDVYKDIAFLPGEAMTALMELYLHRPPAEFVHKATRSNILTAVIRALNFYKGYYDRAKEKNTIDANYAIWQIQAFSRLIVALPDMGLDQTQGAKHAKEYCVDLCQEILQSPAWKQLSRGPSFYPNLNTVEIACGLDALCQGARVVCLDGDGSSNMDLQPLLRLRMDDAVQFLQWSQDQVPPDVLVGYGGLGYGGYCVTEQRLDVTGHALSAVAHLVLRPQP